MAGRVNFHPMPTDLEAIDAAKRVCESCSVREECYAYGVTHSPGHGIWGGTSEEDREWSNGRRIGYSRRWRIRQVGSTAAARADAYR